MLLHQLLMPKQLVSRKWVQRLLVLRLLMPQRLMLPLWSYPCSVEPPS
jgi:hypothetical protein